MHHHSTSVALRHGRTPAGTATLQGMPPDVAKIIMHHVTQEALLSAAQVKERSRLLRFEVSLCEVRGHDEKRLAKRRKHNKKSRHVCECSAVSHEAPWINLNGAISNNILVYRLRLLNDPSRLLPFVGLLHLKKISLKMSGVAAPVPLPVHTSLYDLPVGVKEIIFKQKWFMEWQDRVRTVNTELLTPHYGWRYHAFLEQVHTLRGAVNFHGYKTTINVERFVAGLPRADDPQAGLQRADDPQAGQLLHEVQTKKHKPFLHEGYKDGPLFCCYRKTIVAYSNLRNGCTDLLIGRKLDLLDKYGEVLYQRASVLMETEGGFVDLGDPSSRAEHLWQL